MVGLGSLTVQNASFVDNRESHVFAGDGTNLTVSNSTFRTTPAATNVVKGGIEAVTDSQQQVTITNNSITDAQRSAISIAPGGTGAADATISGNTIGSAAPNSGSKDAPAISLFSRAGDIDALITNNTIAEFAIAAIGLRQDLGSGTLDATVQGNTISASGTTGVNSIQVRSGLSGSADAGQTCVDIGHPTTTALKNTLGAVPSSSTNVHVTQQANTTVRLPGYIGAAGNNPAVVSYLKARNAPTTMTASALNTFGSGGMGFLNATACTLPSP